MARVRRRTLLVAGLLLVALYIGVSILREPNVQLGSYETWKPRNVIPANLRSTWRAPSHNDINGNNNLNSNTHHQHPLHKGADRLARPSKGLYNAAPGFERALPSCRVSDLPDDPLVKEYGQNNIRLSRTYEGTGRRVRSVLQKAMRGERIHIAVVGGSVSTVSLP